MSQDEAVRLTPESLDKYFRLGVMTVFQLSLDVEARLEIDPSTQQLRLFVPVRGEIPEVADFERMQVERVLDLNGGAFYRLAFDARGMHYTAYQFIESIVAHLRQGDSFRTAVSDSIGDLKDLLANRERLSEEQETGLWGEMLLLEHLIGRVGEDVAVHAWLGGVGSEHDFSFADFEAEVKTTRSEARRHRITSDTQLEPSPRRDLYLVSIQVTLAGAAVGGRALPAMIRDVRAMLSSSLSGFDAAVHGAGYRYEDSDLYVTELQLRSIPRAYLVDRAFPSVTRARLEAAVPNVQLISDLRYRIDVGGLQCIAVPAPLDEFCERPA